ncbi:MAG: hypothetical protein LRY51_04485 [Geovibrio sp.]|nr:hypothetical protein [Geovibrio sp.]
MIPQVSSLPKLLAEQANPRADVIWGLAATSLLVMDSKKMLEPYAPKGVERVLPQFKDSRKVPSWVGIDAWMTAFTVNEVEMKKKKSPCSRKLCRPSQT